MYAIIPQQIPQGLRAEINEKILFAINSGKELIPAESIYNCYTGLGGLHELKQSDYASYHEYAQAKKEFEMGQFFTPLMMSMSFSPGAARRSCSRMRS